MFNEIKTHEITVDIVILTIKNDALQVLLVKRNNEPFKDKWAIPGGYVRMSENLDEAAMRVLKEKTNVENIYLEQLVENTDSLGANLGQFEGSYGNITIKDLEEQMDSVSDYTTIASLTNQREELREQLDEMSLRYMELLEKEEG